MELNNKKVLIVDFEDSFTFNIAQFYEERKIYWEIVSHIEFFKNIYTYINHFSNIILGPGPGHPNEYLHYQPKIIDLMNLKTVNLTGICLGHQLIWFALGLDVVPVLRPRHGQGISLGKIGDIADKFDLAKSSINKSNNQEVVVQKYNSLKVNLSTCSKFLHNKQIWECLFYSDELVMSKSKKVLTMQFHPESVGTNFPELFLPS